MPIFDFDFEGKNSTVDLRPDHRGDSEQLLTKLSIFNHDSPDISWAERSAIELINISGAIVTIFSKVDSGNFDEVWDEDADPTYANGVVLKAYFVPQPLAISLVKWGLDIENKVTVVFARSKLLEIFGNRMIRQGDVVEIPFNSVMPIQIANQNTLKENKISQFRVTNATDAGNFKYRWLYYRLDCELLTGDRSIRIEHR